MSMFAAVDNNGYSMRMSTFLLLRVCSIHFLAPSQGSRLWQLYIQAVGPYVWLGPLKTHSARRGWCKAQFPLVALCGLHRWRKLSRLSMWHGMPFCFPCSSSLLPSDVPIDQRGAASWCCCALSIVTTVCQKGTVCVCRLEGVQVVSLP